MKIMMTRIFAATLVAAALAPLPSTAASITGGFANEAASGPAMTQVETVAMRGQQMNSSLSKAGNTYTNVRVNRYYGNRGNRIYGYRRDRGYGNGAAIVGGIVAGALIAGAVRESRASAIDLDRCGARYQTFDRASGTFVGPDGRRYVCSYLN